MSQPLQFLVLTAAAWLNRQQEDVIDYLREENKILRELLGSKPVRFSDSQRRRLAVRGKKLGRKVLARLTGIATPDTILRWYRRLVAQKYNGSSRRGRGRRPTTSRNSWSGWRRRIRSGAIPGSVEHWQISETRSHETR